MVTFCSRGCGCNESRRYDWPRGSSLIEVVPKRRHRQRKNLSYQLPRNAGPCVVTPRVVTPKQVTTTTRDCSNTIHANNVRLLGHSSREVLTSRISGFDPGRVKTFFRPQRLDATRGDPRRHDRLRIFFLYRVWSQPGRNLGPR
jgi:hypothetical protein